MELGVISPPTSPPLDHTRTSKQTYLEEHQDVRSNELDRISRVDENDSCSVQSFHSFRLYSSVGGLGNDTFSIQSKVDNYQFDNSIIKEKDEGEDDKDGDGLLTKLHPLSSLSINENSKKIGII
jgi:hypothetical protein